MPPFLHLLEESLDRWGAMHLSAKRLALIALVGLSSILVAVVAGAVEGEPVAERCPKVRIVYFVPTDREPEPDYEMRIDRVMREVQSFYRKGMEENGYGPMTFELDRNSDGRLNIHRVRAKGPMAQYGRNDAGKVRQEVKASLAAIGIDIDRETIVIFQVLLKWEGDKAIEIGPYVGSGGPNHGTAWVYDDRRLDAALLESHEPGGFYNGPCSLGKFNTHYIGGIAHELGHAFGLPHDCERDSERATRGRSLMGSGNHTYGLDRRGEGKGTFLTPASALPLSVHPVFTGNRLSEQSQRPTLIEFDVLPSKRAITIVGRLSTQVVGIVAYNDPQSKSGDYDAVGWIAKPSADGRFELNIGELKNDRYRLRATAYTRDGFGHVIFRSSFSADRFGRADVSALRQQYWVARASNFFRNRDDRSLKRLAADIRARYPKETRLLEMIEHLQRLRTPDAPKPLEQFSKTDEVSLSKVEFTTARVGWGSPLRDHVLPEEGDPCLIRLGEEFFLRGLFAHAPSLYAVRLGGQWKSFSSRYGLQDDQNGSVVFVVKGDGKEIFRSEVIKDHNARVIDLDVRGVDLLELIVEDAGDGRRSDWGVWAEPSLRR